MKIKFLAFFFLASAGSCVDPYYDASVFQPMIVVQGMITDQPGPYVVSVSRAVPVQSRDDDAGVLYGASVKITDSTGYSENLVEKSPGIFYTQNIQGTVGSSYFITVTTSEGSVYQSTVEKMLPVSDFTLGKEFKQNEDSIANQQFFSTNGVNVILTTEFLEEQQGRVWWRGTGTWHIVTYPGSRKKWTAPPPPGQPELVPDAPECAGGDFIPCTCCDCWITEYNQAPLIMDNEFNSKFDDVSIWFVEANRRVLYDKYHLGIEQLSVSSQVYEFWKSVKIQQSNSSNLFQVPPPKTAGNIKALSINATPVIGYFAASSSKTHSIEITKQDVPYRVYDIDFIEQSCLDVWTYDEKIKPANISNKKPLFW